MGEEGSSEVHAEWKRSTFEVCLGKPGLAGTLLAPSVSGRLPEDIGQLEAAGLDNDEPSRWAETHHSHSNLCARPREATCAREGPLGYEPDRDRRVRQWSGGKGRWPASSFFANP